MHQDRLAPYRQILFGQGGSHPQAAPTGYNYGVFLHGKKIDRL